MQLNVLTDGEIGDSICVLARQSGDGSQLVRIHLSVGDADANHEALEGASFAVFAAGDAGAVSLRVNAPPPEICSDPFRRDRIETFAGKAANLIEALPRIEGAFEALRSLGLSFFRCRIRRCHDLFVQQKTHRQIALAVGE